MLADYSCVCFGLVEILAFGGYQEICLFSDSVANGIALPESAPVSLNAIHFQIGFVWFRMKCCRTFIIVTFVQEYAEPWNWVIKPSLQFK